MSTSRAAVSTGDVHSSARQNDTPQGLLAFASTASNVGPTSSTTELDVLTAAAVTLAAANRVIRIKFHCRGVATSVADTVFRIRIKEGSTTLAEADLKDLQSVNVATHVCCEAIVASPTAASHTYKVTVARQAGTGNGTVASGATGPITLTVEDIGLAV